MEKYEDKFWIVVSKPTRFTTKLIALGILFLLVYVKFFDEFAHPESLILSDEVYLFISLIIVIYLWIAECIDTQKIDDSRTELVNVQTHLREDHINTIASLILSQEAKDPYSRGHTNRVTQYALLLAKRLGLSKEEVDVLGRAAILHDIGKIGISDLVLGKIDKLTDEEWRMIKIHPALGDDILKPLKFLKNERVLVRHHHERYDGTGYPDRLRGADILLGARILAICDFYDAVSSDRPYRKALAELQIIDELKKNRGKQFDPKLTDLLLELIQKEPETLKKIAESAR